MVKLVVLKFNGSFESGFQVNSEIAQEGKSAERGCSGSLPPSHELKCSLANWQRQYKHLGHDHRLKPKRIIFNGSNDPHRQLIKISERLRQSLHKWLNSSEFSLIDKYLREELNREEAVRVLISSDQPEIYQLPWCCWDIVKSYPSLEIAVSNLNFARASIIPRAKRLGKIRILAILGNSEGINLEQDCNFLAALKGEQIRFLVEPSAQELYEYLWQGTWDVVFFAGHSQTKEGQGILYLNAEEELTIEQLSYGFQKAINSGLQLAIFNSCEGLGLAESLSQLSLPQSIVMRMPIPDAMAQQFLRSFLLAYSGGDSLYLAVRKAREQLQSRERQFPCASWLPTIYQNPAAMPLRWSELRGKPDFWGSFQSTSAVKKPFRVAFLASAIATLIIGLAQSWGWLAPWELHAYDRLLSWRPAYPADDKVLVVTIKDEDRTYQREQGLTLNMQGSLADDALNQLIKKLRQGGAKVIASDVIHDFPFSAELEQTLTQKDDFIAICRIRVDQPVKLPPIEPPPQLPAEQLGFSNLVIDDDKVIRRQLLGMAPGEKCETQFSLGLKIALEYLEETAQAGADQQLQIDNVSFPKLEATSGGYHLRAQEAQGYQILLNYSRSRPQSYSLRTLLAKPQDFVNAQVKDKIILLGVEGYNHDLHNTPLSKGRSQVYEPLPGVVIHALMISQIIDHIQGEQALMRWVPDKLELVWVFLGSLLGSMVMIVSKGSFPKIVLGIACSLALVFASCWLFLLNSIWIVAIAPILGLMLSAIAVGVYIKLKVRLI